MLQHFFQLMPPYGDTCLPLTISNTKLLQCHATKAKTPKWPAESGRGGYLDMTRKSILMTHMMQLYLSRLGMPASLTFIFTHHWWAGGGLKPHKLEIPRPPPF